MTEFKPSPQHLGSVAVASEHPGGYPHEEIVGDVEILA